MFSYIPLCKTDYPPNGGPLDDVTYTMYKVLVNSDKKIFENCILKTYF